MDREIAIICLCLILWVCVVSSCHLWLTTELMKRIAALEKAQAADGAWREITKVDQP